MLIDLVTTFLIVVLLLIVIIMIQSDDLQQYCMVELSSQKVTFDITNYNENMFNTFIVEIYKLYSFHSSTKNIIGPKKTLCNS